MIPLARKTSPLNVPPPRKTRFGSRLVLSRVHWVEPKLVAEITYLTWTADNLLRHAVYVGLREDKPGGQAGRPSAAGCSAGSIVPKTYDGASAKGPRARRRRFSTVPSSADAREAKEHH